MKKRRLSRVFKKNSIVLVDFLFNNKVFLSSLGFLNEKLLNNKIKSVFLVYPAKKRHIGDYTFDWFSQKNKWNPFIIGLFRQKGKLGIVFAIPVGEKDFADNSEREQLKGMVFRMEQKRKMLRAESKNFAGVLPGVLSKKDILKDTKEGELTVVAVFRALEALVREEKLGEEYKIVILGGKGFIGRGLVKYLSKIKKFNKKVFAIDVDNLDKASSIFTLLKCQKVIVLNITKKRALSEYIKFFDESTTVLNEVYPEPSIEELAKMRQKEVKCYHIVGLKGQVFPSFPGAYSKGVPCCASFVSCEKDDIIIRKLI